MPQNIGDLRGKLSLIRGGIVDYVQIDFCDGIFVPGKTWPYNGTDEQMYEKIMNEEEGLPYWDEFDFEFDLMVKNAKDDLDRFLRLGAKRLVFHIEAEDKETFKDFLEGIDMYVRDSLEIGVAIDTTTPVEEIFPLSPNIDFVQCMGIEKDGVQGSPFDVHAIEHVKALREKYPDLVITVDGAVNFKTAHDLINAGADRLIVGSAIWKSVDVKDTIDDFQNLVIE